MSSCILYNIKKICEECLRFYLSFCSQVKEDQQIRVHNINSVESMNTNFKGQLSIFVLERSGSQGYVAVCGYSDSFFFVLLMSIQVIVYN